MAQKFGHQLSYAKFPQSLYHGDKFKYVNQSLQALGPGQKILDLGCGAVPYDSPGNEVHSIDADPQIVNALRARGHTRVSLGDANKRIPFEDGTFDVALLLDVIEHFYEPVTAITEVRRVLKNNGQLLIFTPNFGSRLYWLIEKIYFPLACGYEHEMYSEHVFNNKPRELVNFLSHYFDVLEQKKCSYGVAVFVACRKT